MDELGFCSGWLYLMNSLQTRTVGFRGSRGWRRQSTSALLWKSCKLKAWIWNTPVANQTKGLPSVMCLSGVLACESIPGSSRHLHECRLESLSRVDVEAGGGTAAAASHGEHSLWSHPSGDERYSSISSVAGALVNSRSPIKRLPPPPPPPPPSFSSSQSCSMIRDPQN